MGRRFRTWLYYWIDRADTWVTRHPRTPLVIRKPVSGAWCWMMGRGTWTAVGDDLLQYDEAKEIGYAEIPCRWDEDGDAIDWMRFSRTHDWADTCDQGCVIHNRTNHHMALWPLHWRGDRKIFERLCPHGIGHPDVDQYPYWRATDQMWETVHGCCGCCRGADE